MRNLAAFASCVVLSVAASVLFAQDRGGRANDKAEPTHRVRIVTADGDQTVSTDLTFRWTDFVTPPSAQPAGPGGRGGGGGRGDGSGPRGGNGFQRAAGAFSTFGQAVALDHSRDLGRVDRIELDGDLVVQCKPPTRAFTRVNGQSYSGGYGGLAFDVPAGWTFADATDVSALALKRASNGEIVGRMRVRIEKFGDGKSQRVVFDEAAVDAEKLVGPAFVSRFEKIETEVKEDPIQDDGTRVKRLGRKGIEKGSGAALHLEGNLVLDGPFVPCLEILARGDEAEAIVAEARKALASVRFDRMQPAPDHEAAAVAGDTSPPVAPEGDGGGGGERGARGGGGRDPMAAAQALLGKIVPIEKSDFVTDGIYANAKLGLRAKEALPKGFFFTRADELGFTAFMKGDQPAAIDLASVAVTVLWGDPVVKNKIQWFTDRYVDGFLGADEDKPPKAKPATLGKLRGSHLQMERTLPFAGESACDVWFIEDKGRTVLFLASAIGSSGDRDASLKAIEKWLKSIELVKPEP